MWLSVGSALQIIMNTEMTHRVPGMYRSAERLPASQE